MGIWGLNAEQGSHGAGPCIDVLCIMAGGALYIQYQFPGFVPQRYVVLERHGLLEWFVAPG